MTKKAVAHQTINKTLAVAGTLELLIAIDHNRMVEANKISLITDRDVYIVIDGDTPTADNSLEIHAGEGYFDDDITITDRLLFVNKKVGETPHIRGILWGN